MTIAERRMGVGKSRHERAREMARKTKVDREPVRRAYVDETGSPAPDERRESEYEALKLLAKAWPSAEAQIRRKMRASQSWTRLARAALSDFPPPLEESARVHVSGAGKLYHRFRDCRLLVGGKDRAHDRGQRNHVVTGYTLEEARTMKGWQGRRLRECRECIPWPPA